MDGPRRLGGQDIQTPTTVYNNSVQQVLITVYNNSVQQVLIGYTVISTKDSRTFDTLLHIHDTYRWLHWPATVRHEARPCPYSSILCTTKPRGDHSKLRTHWRLRQQVQLSYAISTKGSTQQHPITQISSRQKAFNDRDRDLLLNESGSFCFYSKCQCTS